jgi:hypothetical protein
VQNLQTKDLVWWGLNSRFLSFSGEIKEFVDIGELAQVHFPYLEYGGDSLGVLGVITTRRPSMSFQSFPYPTARARGLRRRLLPWLPVTEDEQLWIISAVSSPPAAGWRWLEVGGVV